MANLFDSVKIKNHKRNKFNLSSSKRLTTEFGRLTPIMCEEVLPADKFKVSTTLKVRFAPMTLPVMERFKAYVHYWFVPNRILWKHWEDFITGGTTGLEDLQHPKPVIRLDSSLGDSSGDLQVSNFAPGSLFDYLGMPAKELTNVELTNLSRNPQDIDALPFMAYQKIYDEFYRDQNLENPFELWTEQDGIINPDGSSDQIAYVNGLMSIRYRAWKKDYFTSALPDPQRGPDVTLPSFGDLTIRSIDGADVPVVTDTAVRRSDNRQSGIKSHSSGGDLQFLNVSDNIFENDDNVDLLGKVPSDEMAGELEIANDVRMATINEVRRGFALQRLYELAARVGGRYAENILGNFGVHAGDSRLQRPEYLGGTVVPIYVGDVLQTSASETDGTPLGMPAGVAGALGSSPAFNKTFKEHGWIIGILSIVPEASYIQGMPRKFLKRDRLDYAWPLLANIGEQEIEDQELFYRFGYGEEVQRHTFGYTPRYAEYRFGLNSIHGDFRTSLRDFHDARIFDSAPSLNKEFITVKPDGNSTGLNRIFAVTSEEYDHLWVHLYNDVLVKRKLPKYGTPI